MKKLENKKIVLVLAIVLAVVLGLTISTYADDGIVTIDPAAAGVGNSSNTSGTSNTNKNSASASSNSNSNSNKPSNNTNKNNATSSYNNTNLPKTGLSDYSPLFIIAGTLVVVSIVAYKKINYYKDV